MPSIGQLDRRVAFQALTETKNDFNEPVQGWTTSFTVWGSVMPLKQVEQFSAGGLRPERMSVFRVRYKSSIVETMRISFDSKYYRIVGIAEIGRREYMHVTAEAVDSGAWSS